MERYYYKNKNNAGFLNLKSPLVDENHIQITKEEFEELTKPKEPTDEQKAAQEKAKKIAEYKNYLKNTDYVVIKLAEAAALNDTNKIEVLLQTYKETINTRKKAREEIELLQKELKNLN